MRLSLIRSYCFVVGHFEDSLAIAMSIFQDVSHSEGIAAVQCFCLFREGIPILYVHVRAAQEPAILERMAQRSFKAQGGNTQHASMGPNHRNGKRCVQKAIAMPEGSARALRAHLPCMLMIFSAVSYGCSDRAMLVVLRVWQGEEFTASVSHGSRNDLHAHDIH